jgi:hypothetical protein
MQARRGEAVFLVALVAMALAGCEYSGPEEQRPASSPPATPQPRSFEENAQEVARLLDASPTDPGMPSESEPAGKLVLVLAPGDYMVSGACAGVHGAKLTIVQADGVPEASSFECASALDRFVRHDGGPITISAVPPTGKPSATGVKVQPNPDRRASELEDLSEWSSQQLQPQVPGELRGAGSSTTPTSGTLMAGPGQYELHFVCVGVPGAELSVSTPAGAEVLAPVQVPCDGQVFEASVLLATAGADLRMSAGDGSAGSEARFAYRLVPTGGPPAQF